LCKQALCFGQDQTHCCDRKAQAACTQSFTLRQQATIEITLLLLARATYIWVLFVLRAHPVRGEPHMIQRYASGEVATFIKFVVCQ